MSRPFISYSIDLLQHTLDLAKAGGDRKTIALVTEELQHRKTPRARKLAKSLEGATATIKNSGANSSAQPRGNVQSKTDRRPTDEQQHAIDLFLGGGSLKINAYAGTGKTSTLEMLAHSTTDSGQYIAFNRSIVAEAKQRFPQTVNCSTTHGLAFSRLVPMGPTT